ncbi:hypothetical protein [Streptomyces sp. NPDC054865]
MRPIVPAVTLLAGRYPDHPAIVVDVSGVRYAGGKRDEQLDADYDVLMERWGGPAAGVPHYGVFDPEVQRHAVDRKLCAYCLRHPDVEPGVGGLWLLPDDDVHPPTWPAVIRTTTPPLCMPHAEDAVQRCEVLRDGYLAVRAPEAEVVGVIGTRFDMDGHVADAEALVLLSDPVALRCVLARYLVLELRDAILDPQFAASISQVPVMGSAA